MLFSTDKKTIIGMVHLLPLPSTVGFNGDVNKIMKQAIDDAKALEAAGVDAVIVENMGDTPFSDKLNKIQLSTMAVMASKVKDNINIPVGIDAAFNDWEANLGIAKAVGATFIRVPVFVDTVIYTGGIIMPCAKELIKMRKQLDAEDIQILADVQVKHTYMLNSNISIISSAKDAVSCGADALIVTGSQIGEATPIDIIKAVKEKVKVPIVVGSGVSKSNVKEQMEIADGAIIGSSLKVGGVISNPISYELTKELLDNLR